MESTEEYCAEETKGIIITVGAEKERPTDDTRLNADFRQHIDFYNEDGEMVDRAAECIAIPW